MNDLLLKIALGVFYGGFVSGMIVMLLSIIKENKNTFMISIFILGATGILSAIFSFYYRNGFDLILHIFLIFPLYAFVIWALYKVVLIHVKTRKLLNRY
ncbi:MAG: hypothetical protein J6D03_09940 [Clostridia bacterium]|nr:hypothetical protein [Clostridia bacterium]